MTRAESRCRQLMPSSYFMRMWSEFDTNLTSQPSLRSDIRKWVAAIYLLGICDVNIRFTFAFAGSINWATSCEWESNSSGFDVATLPSQRYSQVSCCDLFVGEFVMSTFASHLHSQEVWTGLNWGTRRRGSLVVGVNCLCNSCQALARWHCLTTTIVSIWVIV